MFVRPVNIASCELEIKKSRFIAYVAPAANQADALAYLAEIKQRYSDAGHHCWAYISPDQKGQLCAACNDAGEPSGTAGKPILNVLQHNQLQQVIAIVIRYFGGIKLGAGGLVRAYSGATSEAVKQLTLKPLYTLVTLIFATPFSLEANIRHYLSHYESAEIITTDYDSQLTVTIQIDEGDTTKRSTF